MKRLRADKTSMCTAERHLYQPAPERPSVLRRREKRKALGEAQPVASTSSSTSSTISKSKRKSKSVSKSQPPSKTSSLTLRFKLPKTTLETPYPVANSATTKSPRPKGVINGARAHDGSSRNNLNNNPTLDSIGLICSSGQSRQPAHEPVSDSPSATNASVSDQPAPPPPPNQRLGTPTTTATTSTTDNQATEPPQDQKKQTEDPIDAEREEWRLLYGDDPEPEFDQDRATVSPSIPVTPTIATASSTARDQLFSIPGLRYLTLESQGTTK